MKKRAISIIMSLILLVGVNPIQINGQEAAAEDIPEIIIEDVSANDLVPVLKEAEQESEPSSTSVQTNYQVSKEQQEAWKEDGTWESRVEFMQEIENARYRIPKGMDVLKSSDSGGNDLYQFRNMYASMPSTGEVKVLYFMVDFQDMRNEESNYTAENIETRLFSDNESWTIDNGYFKGSITDYYQISSFDKLTIDGEVYGWYTADGIRDDYSNGETGREKLMREVLAYYDDQIDYSQYDSDGDGYIDAIYINYAGELGNWGEQWWSYATSWYGVNGELILDGVVPRGYVFSGEKGYQNGEINNTRYNGIMLHETGHLLGLPDYYDYDVTVGEGGGLGGADMMDANIGDHNLFSKLMLGWIDDSQIQIADMDDDFTDYQLNPSQDRGELLIVAEEWDGSYCSEYYLLDYYTNDGLNQGVFDTNGGIRIWHVNATLGESGYGFVHNNSYSTNKLLKLYEADGRDEISNTWMPDGTCVTDEDLYHTGDILSYFTYPNSDYYGKKFTGIHIQVGEIMDGKYTLQVKRDMENTDEPQIVSVIPDTTKSGLYMDSVYDARWFEITFNNTCSIVDESKLSIETRSGTTASIGAPVIVDKRLIFWVNGDSSTKAVIKIEPGLVANSSGIENTWSKSYEINTFIPLINEEEALVFWQDTSPPEVRGTFTDGYGNQYAVVSTYDYRAYLIQFDSSGTCIKIDLDLERPANIEPPVLLSDDVFVIGYKSMGNGSARDIAVFRTDGTLLSVYQNEYGSGSSSGFTRPYKASDDSILFFDVRNGNKYCYKLTYDDEYNFTETKVKIGEYYDVNIGTNLLQSDDQYLTISYTINENSEEMEEQKLRLWVLTETDSSCKEIILPKEVGYSSFSCTSFLEEEDSYLFIGTAVKKEVIYGKEKAIAIRISKEDLSVLDYVEFGENEYWIAGGRQPIADVEKISDDEYVFQFICTVPQDISQFLAFRDTSFMVCTDGSFNTKWVKIIRDWQHDVLVRESDGRLYTFTRGNNIGIYQMEYHHLEGTGKTTSPITVENNFSEEKITRQVVVGGQFRYIIPQIEGKEYQVFVDGMKTPVSGNVLTYLNTISETGNHNVRIVYSDMEEISKKNQVISFTESYVKIYGDDDFALDAVITQGDGILIYTSENSDIVEVTDTGIVTIKGIGNTTINVKALETEEFMETLITIEITIKQGVDQIFNDIPKTQWYWSAVQFVYDNEIMKGKGNGNFDPAGNLTRAEFATTLYSIEGRPEVSYKDTFADVPNGQWFSNPVLWANQANIASGYGNGKFGISDSITREQLALMVYKYVTEVRGFEPDRTDGVLEKFKDNSEVSNWAVTAMEWAVTNGIISGTGDNRLNPQGNALRCECAQILKKISDIFGF